MEFWDAPRVRAALGPVAVVDALESALRDGLDPEADPPRSFVAVPHGDLLLMPSTSSRWTGAKVLTIRDDSDDSDDGAGATSPRAREQPLIQGAYLLFEGDALTPVAVLEAAALTAVRTPAVSALAVRHLAPRARRALVLGAGVQGAAHAEVLVAACGVGHVDVAARRLGAALPVADAVRQRGASAAVLDVGDTAALAAAVGAADVVVCATRAGVPLFDGALVREEALVVAIGSHEPTRRDVDSALAARAQVVVESRASALAESGAVVIPLAEGLLDAADLVPLAAVVRGEAAVSAARPRLFAGTGMSWQDLVVASALVCATITPQPAPQPAPTPRRAHD